MIEEMQKKFIEYATNILINCENMQTDIDNISQILEITEGSNAAKEYLKHILRLKFCISEGIYTLANKIEISRSKLH